MPGTAEGAVESVPGPTRWVVRAFLAVFLVCAIFRLELWPFSGFRLFSQLRHETRNVWVAETVTANGRAAPLWFSDLPRAYQGFALIMPKFRRLPAGSRRAVCETWLSEA